MNAFPIKLAEVIRVVLRLFLGGFYLLAGAFKIKDPGAFAEAVGNFRLVPHELTNLVAITLPWIEGAAGLFLILGIWEKASVWLINALTFVFIAGITSAIARGLNIDCGCFGTVGARKVGLTAVAEDAALLACGLWLVWKIRDNRTRSTTPQAALPFPTH